MSGAGRSPATPAGVDLARLVPPGPVLEIARTLEDAGFETWCVGGAVRDALLGEPHIDWDLATAATPREVRRLFRRTVPVGIEFGTVGVLDVNGTMHEVTTFRRDVRTDGRHAEVEFGASLDEDLARRDFTINAIAYDPARRVLHDPFHGLDDLRSGIVRAVGEPAARMREDRLRALRAIRFAARFGFEIEPGTWTAVVGSAPHLGRLSMERVKQELEKTMEQVARPSRALRLWRESGALHELVPALDRMSDVALASLDVVPPPAFGGGERRDRVVARLTALFGDLAPKDAERALRALRFSNQDVAWIGAVLARWQAIEPSVREALAGGVVPGDVVIRRWAGATGRTRVRATLRLGAARFAAERSLGLDGPAPRVIATTYRRALRIAYHDPVEIGDLAIDGDDLRAAGVPPGPGMRRVLVALLDDVLADPARNRRDWLLARVAELERVT